MWMLLQQVTQSEVENLHEVNIYWDEEASDIPEDWKAVVSSCLDPDPNRIRLPGLVGLWENAKCKKQVSQMVPCARGLDSDVVLFDAEP